MADLPSNDEHHRSTSLMSLPPDILDKIFEKVVAGRGGSKTLKSLKNLSHVCRATRRHTEKFAQFQLERMALVFWILVFYDSDSDSDSDYDSDSGFALRKSSPTEIIERYLNKYIDGGGDVDAPVEKGRTLLHIAATMSSNTYDSCKVLIEKNANVNKQDKYGDTPLHLAAGNGYHNICKLLVENNANINQPNNKGNTPLHLAAEERHIDVIEILLDGGADTSIQNNVGNTARDVCEPVTRVRVTKALRCYILLGGDASELDSESESDESEVSGSHSSWDSDDS